MKREKDCQMIFPDRRKSIAVAVTVLLFPVALAVSLYECHPTEPEPGEMVVCPMEGLEATYSGEFGWIAHEHEPWMVLDQPRVVWDLGEVDGPSPDGIMAKLDEFMKRLHNELGDIEPGEVDIETVRHLIDEFRQETGLEIEGIIKLETE